MQEDNPTVLECFKHVVCSCCAMYGTMPTPWMHAVCTCCAMHGMMPTMDACFCSCCAIPGTMPTMDAWIKCTYSSRTSYANYCECTSSAHPPCHNVCRSASR